jgi:hypothetical protein
LSGPRLLLAGAPVDGTALHAVIESHGAVVVEEAGPWASVAAGDDVDSNGDPLAAIANHYREHAFGARTSAHVWGGAAPQTTSGVDAVVVSLPPDDAVFGWDYPALRDRLEASHIPHICLRNNPNDPLTAEDDARLGALIGRAARKEASVG